MSDAPNAGDAAQNDKPVEQPTPTTDPPAAPAPTTVPAVSTGSPSPTVPPQEEPDANQAQQDAEINREVSEAMSAMSAEDLADLTLSSPTPTASPSARCTWASTGCWNTSPGR